MFRATKLSTFILAMGWLLPMEAQTDTLFLTPVIHLDSVVISEVADGFSVGEFIHLMEEDTGFYQAFRNLRTITYSSDALVRMFDDEGLTEASYSNSAKQILENHCRHLEFQQEHTTGNFFDKHGEAEYYTARLFSHIFLYRDTVCSSQSTAAVHDPSGLEKRKEQLKVLMFQPGQPVEGIPFIKNELGVFEEDMTALYDYDMEAVEFRARPCFKFTIEKKAEVSEKKVVLQSMETWFDRSTYQIVARNYHLKEDNFTYDFDVHMQVLLGQREGKEVPVWIYYNGSWDVPGKKRETGSVQITVR
ncbi:MAG TPA: hypothetical protein PKX04_10955 [Chitinophagales bacterium]|nr:hypothetical protein [Bacteroidota bacterium]HPE98469.1 hypothetical protein [Chitinophagales bacterium]HAE34492.1 hypothetical protein [Bacteroidota bacterium]HPR28611.1 hypothetical protein [Chitinophagales bacterium]HQU39488.1 hypothetical protein [Chitinophagales bacterium]